jgi:hypothetical protein
VSACGALLVVACSSRESTQTTATSSTTNASSVASTGGHGGSGAGGMTNSSTGGDISLGGSNFMPTPVKELSGLTSITFYERSGGTEPTAYTFDVAGPELSTRLDDPLSDDNRDIKGVSTEFYDVYYSDEQGVAEADGSYLTISGVFGAALPAGGGLNLAEIGLNYSDQNTEYGNYVASYVVLGDNGDDSRVDDCIDGDLQSHTAMGNTVGQSERLRLTLGFASTSGPPK